MKVLIGTPIHILKDYCMERWVENVAQLMKVHPADLILVDNSPTRDYMEKVKGYLKKHGIENYEMRYLEIAQGDTVNKSKDEQIHERVAHAQEIIRQYALQGDYDAFFSWECDQIIPTTALHKLIEVMQMGNFLMVNHNCWDKNVPGGLCFEWGVTLVSREYLQKYTFMLEYDREPIPDSWYNAQIWYRKRLIRDHAPFIDLVGVIDPILHL